MKFAIVGCGAVAHLHASVIQQNGTLTAVCDNVADKANAFAERYNTTAFTDWNELLKAHDDVDVAVICSPNGHHAEHSIAALNAKCHVLCEMPMAIHVFDCTRMLEASVLNARKLFVVKQNRFNASVAAVKQLLDDDALGNVKSFQLNCFWNANEDDYNSLWKGTLELDGGILYTQFAQFADVLYWLCGDVKNVNAISKNFNHSYIQFEDAVIATLEMSNDIIGTLHATINSHQKNMEGSLTLFCEKGTIKIGGEYLNNVEYLSTENNQLNDKLHSDDRSSTDDDNNYSKVYDYMRNVIETQQEQITNAYDSMKTIEMIEKIYTSARGIVV